MNNTNNIITNVRNTINDRTSVCIVMLWFYNTIESTGCCIILLLYLVKSCSVKTKHGINTGESFSFIDSYGIWAIHKRKSKSSVSDKMQLNHLFRVINRCIPQRKISLCLINVYVTRYDSISITNHNLLMIILTEINLIKSLIRRHRNYRTIWNC